jgi:hypothetical protein
MVELEQKPEVAFQIRAYGMDAEGRPFSDLATARRLNRQTAFLDDLEHHLKVGEIVGVQYKDRKARARVTWAGTVNGIARSQAGIQLLVEADCPWVCELDPNQLHGEYSGYERRRHPRYKVPVALELKEFTGSSQLQARCMDISLGGCYVETLLPFPLETVLNAGLWVEGERIGVTAVVRTSDGNVGMGIEFVNLTSHQQSRLEQFLLSSQSPAPLAVRT